MAGKSDDESADKGGPNLLEQIKESGPAGIVSLTVVEGTFWFSSIPLSIIAAHQQTGVWELNVFTEEARATTAAFIGTFVTFGGFLQPIRLGIALALTPFFKRLIGGDEEAPTK